jgi:hypothetical protein
MYSLPALSPLKVNAATLEDTLESQRTRIFDLSRCFDRRSLLRSLFRGVMHFVAMGLSYLLMLAAMSFNVAIFFAVITGLAVGTMLFGGSKTYHPRVFSVQTSCH